jgi:hypothetical protein
VGQTGRKATEEGNEQERRRQSVVPAAAAGVVALVRGARRGWRRRSGLQGVLRTLLGGRGGAGSTQTTTLEVNG